MNATIKDIAKAAGVSPSTVSRVVNDSPLISEETKVKIRKLMKEMNYIQNISARQLATQSSFNIGFLINSNSKECFMDPFFYEMVGGIQSVVSAKGYELSICNINYIESNDNFINRFINSRKVDGLIIHVSIINKKIVDKLNALNFPYVVIGQPIESLNVSWVDIDNKKAGEIAVNHLLLQQYKKIAFIGGTQDESVSFNRKKGYLSALRHNNIAENDCYIRESMGTQEDGYNIMKDLLKLDNPPNAVIGINNFTTYGALIAIKENNLNIPSDIALVTFDDHPIAPYTTPTLTSLNINIKELGVFAGDMLMDLMSKKITGKKATIISPELSIRDSSMSIKK